VTKVDADNVEVFGLARLASDTPFSIEAKVGADWKSVVAVTADALGYGKKTIPIAGATAWRIDYSGDKSRETGAR